MTRTTQQTSITDINQNPIMTVLKKFLTTPSKLALAFDRKCTKHHRVGTAPWKTSSGGSSSSNSSASSAASSNTILCLDINMEHIGMTIGYHPSSVASSYYLGSAASSTASSSSGASSSASFSSETLEPIRIINPPKRPRSQKRRLLREGAEEDTTTATSIAAAAATDADTPSSNNTYEVLRQLDHVVKEYNVCGVLVSWPVQRDTGKVGAACGRVLYTLEDLITQQQQRLHKEAQEGGEQQHHSCPSPVLFRSMPPADAAATAATTTNGNQSQNHYTNIPLCLWRGSSIQVETRGDEWGRCPSYAVDPTDPYYIAAYERSLLVAESSEEENREEIPMDGPYAYYSASKERYYHHSHYYPIIEESQEEQQAVWDDFCKVHWPLHHYNQFKQKQSFVNHMMMQRTDMTLARSKKKVSEKSSLIPGYSKKWKNALHDRNTCDRSSSSSSVDEVQQRQHHHQRTLPPPPPQQHQNQGRPEVRAASTFRASECEQKEQKQRQQQRHHDWEDSSARLAALVL